MRYHGKVVLVAGGSMGIGESISRRFAAEGAIVAVAARNLERTEALVADLAAAGQTARAYQADCSNVADINRLVAQVIADLGHIDVVVNSAGTFRTMSVEDTTEAVWDEQVDLNLKGSFFLVQSVLPHFRKRGGGKIVLISSIAGVRAFPNCAAYCASKGGLVNLTRALAAELAKENINVNTIAPGNVETPINAHLRGPGNEAYMQLMSDRTPTGRAFLEPTDISGVAAFLGSDDAKAMHGSVVVVDDGWCAW